MQFEPVAELETISFNGHDLSVHNKHIEITATVNYLNYWIPWSSFLSLVLSKSCDFASTQLYNYIELYKHYSCQILFMCVCLYNTFRYNPLKVCDDRSFNIKSLCWTLYIVWCIFHILEAGSVSPIKHMGGKRSYSVWPISKSDHNRSLLMNPAEHNAIPPHTRQHKYIQFPKCHLC